LSIQPQSGGLPSAHANLLSPDYDLEYLGRDRRIPWFASVAKPHSDPRLPPHRICSAFGCPQYPLLVHFASSDSSIVKIDESTGGFEPLRLGRVTLTVSTVAYGV